MSRTRSFFLLLIIALLMNTVLPFYALYLPTDPLAPLSLKESRPLFGQDSILICTAEGLRWVAWEDLQREDLQAGHQGGSHQSYQCALCYMASHGIQAIPLVMVAYFLPYYPRMLPAYDGLVRLAGQYNTVHGLWARAPPFI